MNPFEHPIATAKLKELVWKIDREVWAKVEAKEATTSWGREQTSFLISQYFGQSSNELTRLRELLKRVHPYIKDCNTDNYEDRSVGIYYDQELANLVKDIDNALNHKP